MTNDADVAALEGAAESGDAAAMFDLSREFKAQGDRAKGDAWVRRAAELGEPRALHDLALSHYWAKNYDEAEHWYVMAAEAGNATSMAHIGMLLSGQGRLDEALGWYWRGAEAGNTDAMINLAGIHRKHGDDREAERWYRIAAEHESVPAMFGLGLVLSERHEIEEAVVWYRRAAAHGDAKSMTNLAHWLAKEGNVEEAERWLHTALEQGDNVALCALGDLRLDRGDLVNAEDLYRRAVGENLDGGRHGLEILQAKREPDHWLDALEFTTFAWPMVTNRDKIRRWRGDHISLTVRYIPEVPELTAWDADTIRRDLDALSEDIGAGGDHERDLGFDTVDPATFSEALEHTTVLDVGCVEVDGARCVAIETRHQAHGEVHFSWALSVLFEQCFWLLKLETEVQAFAGAREGAVFAAQIETTMTTDVALDDPSSPDWDGIIDIDQDQLTRIRRVAAELRNSIKLGPLAQNLKKFDR